MPPAPFELALHHTLLLMSFGLGAATLLITLVVVAPYGRHGGRWPLPEVHGTVGWILMELPAAAALPLCALASPRPLDAPAIALLALWEIHYLHRTFLFPLRRMRSAKPMSVAVIAAGMGFNLLNGYLNGRWLFAIGPARAFDTRFAVGVLVFALGLWMNVDADETLLRLRAPGETGYRIPEGRFYHWICCPNYLGEIIEWSGFALCAWSPAALSFALYTAANLVPRALVHRRWYRERFAEYPRSRRAILPFLL